MVDVDWTELGYEGRTLSALLSGMGWFYDAHRAEADVTALLHLLSHRLDEFGGTVAGRMIGNARRGDGMGAASRLRQAETLFRKVVQWTGMNTPGDQHAGAIENLAEAIRSMRSKFNDEAHGSRIEEIELFEVALGIYETLGDEGSAGRIRNRLHSE